MLCLITPLSSLANEHLAEVGVHEIDGVLLVAFFFGFLDDPFGILRRRPRPWRDNILEFSSLIGLSVLVRPAMGLVSVWAMIRFGWQSSGPVLLDGVTGLLAYLLVDDVLNYLYHRAAHKTPWLWKLHRAHHSATSMGAFVTYRNGLLYYALMPNLWWTALCVAGGMGVPVMYAMLLKHIVVMSAHSKYRWDRRLYAHPLGSKLMTILERIFVTPSTHHMHHGKYEKDGISYPNGNFSNMFFFWDLLFRTAKITRKYPNEYGIELDSQNSIAAELLYPLFGSDDLRSELRPAFFTPWSRETKTQRKKSDATQ